MTLFDAAEQPFSGASRSNEGKIHLGYLYAGEPTLETTRRLPPGALAFRALAEELIGGPIADAVTPEDDVHLVHRDSVAGADVMKAYCAAVSDLLAAHADASDYPRAVRGLAQSVSSRGRSRTR